MNPTRFRDLRAYSLALLVFLVFGLATSRLAATPFAQIERAVRDENVAQIQSMIGADGGTKSDTGSLALMVAALWDKQTLAESLINQGISPNASPLYTHEAGETPLIYAIFAANEKMVAFLLARGANPNFRGDLQFRDCRGRLPLDLATKWGFLEIASRLLDAGADPNAGNNWAVETANQQGDAKMFELLLAHGGRLPKSAGQAGTSDPQPGPKTNPDTNAFPGLGLAQLLPPVPGAPPKPTQAKGRCRLAIISDDPNTAAADLLAVQLAGHPGLEIVERRELERIFAEKQLTRQFAARDASYNNIAALLRADALLLIRNRDIAGMTAVEARFIRVNPGIVLDTMYRSAPLTETKKWANEMAARVSELAGKAVNENATAISILDVHAALPIPATVGLERTLTVLLHDRLVHHPRFIVLERAEMEKVAFENAGEKPFWAGSYLADPSLDAALDHTGNFTLALRLQPAGNGSVLDAKVSGKRSDPARAVDDLLQAIDKQLGAAGAVPRRNAESEANSYLEEARWAMAAKQPARAAAAVEVAWALGLQNLDVARLRVESSEQAVQSSVSFRYGPQGASAAEALDFAVQACGLWDDVLQGSLLRQRPNEFQSWVESVSALTEAAKLAVISVGPATEQVQQADRLAILRKTYWNALNDALAQSGMLASNSVLPLLISKTQLTSARIMLPETDELRGALQEIISRHFSANDASSRAEILLGLRWRPAFDQRIETYSGPRQLTYHYPDNMRVREWLLDSLRRLSAPEGRFVASAVEFEGPTILSSEHSAQLMENLWAMRDELAQDGEILKLYYGRLHALTENEPISNSGYVPRVYRLHLDQDGSAEKSSQEMTRFEFNRRLYLYLIDHASKAQPAFDDLVRVYATRYSAEQKEELQQANARYSSRTGTAALALSSARRSMQPRPGPAPASASAPAPDILPPLRISRFWHPFGLGQNISPDFDFNVGSMLWAEDHLWFEGTVVDFEPSQQRTHHYLFSVEPMTMKTEMVELPPLSIVRMVPGATVDHGVRFVVRPEVLVVAAAHDFLALYDRAARRWQTFPEVQPARVGRPEIIGDVAYLIAEDGNAVLSFDLKQRAAKVLASARRRPAESPLDDPALWFSQVFKGQGDELIVIAQSDHTEYLKVKSIAQAWSPSTHSWRLLEGPVRSLSENVAGKARGRITATPFLARCCLDTVGNATAEGRLKGSGLALHLRNQSKPFDSIPLLALPEGALELPENRYGPQNLSIRSCFECPAGYVFPTSPGPGFWFLPKTEFASYVQLASRPVETRKP